MPLIITKQSHTDHNIPDRTLGQIVDMFDDKNEFFKGEFTVPDGKTIPCGLYGPAMGDGIVDRNAVFMVKRGDREGLTPMIKKPMRESNKFFIVGGPNGPDACILYTCYGGPEAVREPWDPSIADNPHDKTLATMYWKQHALVVPEGHAIVRIRTKNLPEVVRRTSSMEISIQEIDKACGPHPVTDEPMQYIYVECSGTAFHRIIEDIADAHHLHYEHA